MLKKETLEKLASLAKVKTEDLETAIKDEKEVDVTISEKLSTYTDDEIGTIKTNTYNDGKKAGVEMEIKDIKEKLGLEFQGKTISGLLDAHQKKVLSDAKIEPEKKVQELNDKIANLQNTVKDYEQKLSDKENEVIGVKVNSELYKHIPKLGDNGPALGADDVIQLMRGSGYEFKLEDGSTKVYKDGKKLQDNLSNDLPAKDAIDLFLKEKKLVSDPVIPGGRGGDGGRQPAKYGKLSEIKKQFESEGKSTLGSEFSEAVNKAVAENKEFDMGS